MDLRNMRPRSLGSTMPAGQPFLPNQPCGSEPSALQGIGTPGFLGTLVEESGDGEEEEGGWGGGPREEQEGRKEEGQRSFPGPQSSRAIPAVGQAVFCFGNVTKTSKAVEATNKFRNYIPKEYYKPTPHPKKENTTSYQVKC